MPSSSEVRTFGKLVRRGDRFRNRYREHDTAPYVRELQVVNDVRGLPFFIVKVTRNPIHPDQVGKVTWMRGRTLLERYKPVEGHR